MLEFRPHHFLCTLGFQGKGYSDAFVENFSRIVASLDDETLIRVTPQTDSICGPCPNRVDTTCSSEAKIGKLDQAHADALELKAGDVLSWKQAKERVASRLSLEKFHLACALCSWKELGVCEEALRKLKGLIALFLFVLPPTIFHSVSWAKPVPPAKPTPAAEPTVSTLQPLTVLEEKLRQKKPLPAALALKKGYAALGKKKFADARNKATQAASDPLFKDHGLWLLASAHLEQAEQLTLAKAYNTAKDAAEKAIAPLLKIQEAVPYSPFIDKLTAVIARAEFLSAHASCKLKKWQICRIGMEKGFFRLADSGDYGHVHPDFLKSYGEACSKARAPECEGWARRLGSYFNKNSVEIKALSTYLPTALEKARPEPTGPKLTRSYRGADADAEAFDEAMKLYFERDYDDAAAKFRAFLEQYPKSALRPRALYWLGEAFFNDDEQEDAKKTFEQLQQESPLSFYGLLASLKAGKSFSAAIEGLIPSGLSTDPFLMPWEEIHLNRAEHLLRADARELAVIELDRIKPRDRLSSPFLMYLAVLNNKAENHPRSFSILSELIQRSYNGINTTYVVQMIFPTPYLPLIDKHAKENSLDPILVLSLIKQESAFRASASSAVGAQGLMQLMHGTALDLSADLVKRDLLDTEKNLNVGARYLSKMLTRFNGNIALALAAYNAGPGAVDRWLKNGTKKDDLLLFIESVPYKETREYVAGIIRNYYWYSSLLPGAAPVKPLSYFWTGVKQQTGSE